MTGEDLVRAVEARATAAALRSPLHGPRHWRDVARVGIALCEGGVRCNREVVLLFALLHDSQRYGDGSDPHHGTRAAQTARDMRHERILELSDVQAVQLEQALFRHTAGRRTADATIGACWDADRFTLSRVGVDPSPPYISTVNGSAFREMADLGLAIVRGPDIAWEEIALAWAEASNRAAGSQLASRPGG